MIEYNPCMKANDMVRIKLMPNGEKLMLTVEHRLVPGGIMNLSGWAISICVLDVDDEPEWGFFSGWHNSYPEAKTAIMNNGSYRRYPFYDCGEVIA